MEPIFNEIYYRSERIRKRKVVSKLRQLSVEYMHEILKGANLVYLVYGLRGVGKTTLLANLYSKVKNPIYVSADLLRLYGTNLLEFLEYAYSLGYRTFLIDEVHLAKNWEKEIKIFYDEFEPKIILSGSSSLYLLSKKSELSRRVVPLEMKPLSFREYMYLKEGILLEKVKIKDIIDYNKRKMLISKLLPYINLYEPYICFDALPVAFFSRNESSYLEILNKIVENDLLTLKKLSSEDIFDTFRIIRFFATSEPGRISYSSIASSIGRSKKFVIEIVSLLEKAGLLKVVEPYGKGKKGIRKEHKIFFPLSFRYNLAKKFNVIPSKGALREDFFVQHVKNCNFFMEGKEKTPDFIVDDMVFEVGGRSKSFTQVKKFEKAFLVKEAVMFNENEIPLYLFGLLY